MPLSARPHSQSWYLKIHPAGKLPALVDRDRGDVAVFESSSIVLYLTKVLDKGFLFHFEDDGFEAEMLSWIFLHHGGAASSQLSAAHFLRAPVKITYAAHRFLDETLRAYEVFETRLASSSGRDFLVGPGRGKFSLADIVAFTWARAFPYTLGIPHLSEAGFHHLQRWVERIEARPGTKRALESDVYRGMTKGEGWEERSREIKAWLDASEVKEASSS